MARRLLASAWPFWAALGFAVAYEIVLLLIDLPDVGAPWQALTVPAVLGLLAAIVGAALDAGHLHPGGRLLVVASALAIPLGLLVAFGIGNVLIAQGAAKPAFIPIMLVVDDLVVGGLAATVWSRLGRATIWPVVIGLCAGWAAWISYVAAVYRW